MAAWQEFLERMGWTDPEVLNRQTDAFVHLHYQTFLYRLAAGLLDRM